jgi:hypothetical protein
VPVLVLLGALGYFSDRYEEHSYIKLTKQMGSDVNYEIDALQGQTYSKQWK